MERRKTSINSFQLFKVEGNAPISLPQPIECFFPQVSDNLIPQLYRFTDLIDLRSRNSRNVHLSRRSESPTDIDEQVSPLRILWTATLTGSLQLQPDICQNFFSLVLEEPRSHSDWRRILSRPAQNSEASKSQFE